MAQTLNRRKGKKNATYNKETIKENERKYEEQQKQESDNESMEEQEQDLYETPIGDIVEPNEEGNEINQANTQSTTTQSHEQDVSFSQSEDTGVIEDLPTSNQAFDPHNAPRKERDYAMDNSKGEQVIDRVAPPISDNLPPVTGIDGDGYTPQNGANKLDDKKKANPLKNPETKDLDNAEKLKAAKVLAKTMVDAYEKIIPPIFKLASKTSEKKMSELSMKGDIDFTILLETPDSGKVTAKEYVDGINNQADQLFNISDEFKENIMPPLTRILAKKEMGMTDEQLLAYYVGADLIQKTQAAYQLRGYMKDTLDFFKETTKNRKGDNANIVSESKDQNNSDTSSKTTSSIKPSMADVLNNVEELEVEDLGSETED